MGLWSAIKLATLDVDSPTAVSLPSGISGLINNSYRSISRVEALQVPEIKRARDLIASTISTADIYEEVKGMRMPTRAFLQQFDPDTPNSKVIAQTCADLFFDAVSVWYITNRYAEDFRPYSIKHVPSTSVQLYWDTLGSVTQCWINGQEVSLDDVIIFQHSQDGILTTGARTIWTSLRIEQAVRSFMEYPMPTLGVKYDGPKLTQEQLDDLDAYYAEKVALRSTIFADRNIQFEAIGWNPEQLALDALRANQATALARLTGVPAYYLSADAGSSMTYQNNTQARQDFYSLTLMPYIVTIEETLSSNKVTGRGTEVHFDLSDFLRADPSLRASIYEKLIPLGVMTIQEARVMEGLVEEPND